MQNPTTRKIVIAGVLSAIAILLGATHWGFIPWFAGAALTIMHVPAIIGAVLEGPIVGLVIGALFGLFSLIQGAVAPTGPTDTWFINPALSVLPRLFIGPAAWLVHRLVKKARTEGTIVLGGFLLGLLTASSYLIAEHDIPSALFIFGTGLGLISALLYRSFVQATEIMALAIAGVMGSLTNTILVLSAIGLFKYLPWKSIYPIAVANGLPEAAVGAIITVAVVASWKGIRRGRQGADL